MQGRPMYFKVYVIVFGLFRVPYRVQTRSDCCTYKMGVFIMCGSRLLTLDYPENCLMRRTTDLMVA